MRKRQGPLFSAGTSLPHKVHAKCRSGLYSLLLAFPGTIVRPGSLQVQAYGYRNLLKL